MEKIVSVLFYLKRSKMDRSGNVPIYMRITVDGIRAELSTHRKIKPTQWDSNRSMAIPTEPGNVTLNKYLTEQRAKIYKQCNIIESLDLDLTTHEIKKRLKGSTRNSFTLVNAFEKHNKYLESKIGSDISITTYKHYKGTLTKLKSFLDDHYRKTDIRLEELKHSFATNFEVYLKTNDKCSHNTTIKHIVRLKKIMKFALQNEWTKNNPFINFRCQIKETNRGYLTEEELERLERKKFSIRRLEKVRDIFLFCCYTGLAWSDVSALTNENIQRGIDRNKWITIYRKKTDNRSSFRILDKAQVLIDQYKNDPEALEKGKLFPVNSNQRMNGYLKEIADVCDIKKNLSMHLARHTFATTVALTNGMSLESIAKVLGHKSIKTTEIYAKIVDKKVSEEMNALNEKMKDPSLKQVV